MLRSFQVQEFELKILWVSDAVMFAQHDLDLVVDSFERAGCDAVLEVVQDAPPVHPERLCHLFHLCDTGRFGLLAPGNKKPLAAFLHLGVILDSLVPSFTADDYVLAVFRGDDVREP